jgi:hypothetical protein
VTRALLDAIGPALRALAEALVDKAAGFGVQVLLAWLQSAGGG